MATTADDDDNNYTYAMMLANILEICKDGCRKDKIMQKNTPVTRSAKKNYGRDDRQGIITLH
jgi:hypothetical protein